MKKYIIIIWTLQQIHIDNYLVILNHWKSSINYHVLHPQVFAKWQQKRANYNYQCHHLTHIWHTHNTATKNNSHVIQAQGHTHMTQTHTLTFDPNPQLAKKIITFWYSSSVRIFRSCCRSLSRSCLSSIHCWLKYTEKHPCGMATPLS